MVKGFKDPKGIFHPIQRYKKVRKALDPIRTLNKTKGVKMTSFLARPVASQFATTLKKDEEPREGIHVTAEWSDFIKENYPNAKWTVPTSYWRMGEHDTSNWGLPLELEQVIEGSEHQMFQNPDNVYDRSSPDTKTAWTKLRRHITAGTTSVPELSRKFLRLYAEDQAKERIVGYVKYGRFSDAKGVRRKDGYGISELLSPLNQFIQDVQEGKILDRNGLKVSVSQVQGITPEGGFLNAVLGQAFGMAQRRNAEVTGYYSGLVVKISGDDDPELSDSHNTWAVIKKVIDDYHYEVIPENGSSKDSFIIRDEDVKGLVGDKDTDLIGIGEQRHKDEVIPLIDEAMRGE